MDPVRREWTIYKSLWRAAESAGTLVRYVDGDDLLEGGAFDVRGGRPRVTIFRPFFKVVDKPTLGRHPRAPRDMPLPDIIAELFILAHELGHLASWREPPQRMQRHWSALRRLERLTKAGAVEPCRSDGDLFEEELRAWMLAEHILYGEGYRTGAAFEAFRERAIHRYSSALRPRAH